VNRFPATTDHSSLITDHSSPTMELTINNNKEVIPGEILTIADLLAFKQYTFRLLVIKINGILVKKDEYANARVNPGDDVQILHLMSGG